MVGGSGGEPSLWAAAPGHHRALRRHIAEQRLRHGAVEGHPDGEKRLLVVV